jgi:hypothetical protein
MTGTEIREALTEIRDAVPVPPVDQVAFRARVRTERRRRTTGRALAAVAGLAAASAVVTGVVGVVRDPAPPATVAAAPVASPEQRVGFVVGGRLVVGGPGGYRETAVPARNVLGVTGDLLVLVDGTGALVGVPVDADGRPGPERRLLAGVVELAWLDGSDGTVYVVDAARRLRSWSPGDGGWATLPPAEGDLFLVDTGHRVESAPDGGTLVADGVRRALPSGDGISGGGLAGSVLAWETMRALRFYDADTGEQLLRLPGEWHGALSPGGTSYAGSHAGRVRLVDTGTGSTAVVAGPASLDGVTWTAADTFVGAERADDGTTLWECRADLLTCTRLYADPTGTLQLHS